MSSTTCGGNRKSLLRTTPPTRDVCNLELYSLAQEYRKKMSSSILWLPALHSINPFYILHVMPAMSPTRYKRSHEIANYKISHKTKHVFNFSCDVWCKMTKTNIHTYKYCSKSQNTALILTGNSFLLFAFAWVYPHTKKWTDRYEAVVPCGVPTPHTQHHQHRYLH